MCSFDILLPIGGAVSLVFGVLFLCFRGVVSLFSGCCFFVFGVLFLCFRGVVLNFRGLDFNFTKVTILLHIPQYLFPFFQLLNSEAYRLRVVLRPPPDQIPSAVRLDSVRRPIGFRPPPDQIPSAARSDSVRRPIRFRSPSDGNVCRCARRKLSETTIYSAHYPHSLLYSCAKSC